MFRQMMFVYFCLSMSRNHNEDNLSYLLANKTNRIVIIVFLSVDEKQQAMLIVYELLIV
jgi:hypothetical protein